MRESIHRSPPEQRRLDEAADDDRASARPHTAAAVLAAQSGAGNQAVARALAGRRTLSRWREFDGARGDAQYDYKIVNGNHATAGRYHIKFHNVESLGVFNEIHVVFENRNPMGYFFYSDAGVFIPGKSSTGLMYPELEAISRELVDEQLRTSEVVPDQLVQERRDEVAEQKLKDQAVKDQNKIGQVYVTGLGLPSELAGHVDNRIAGKADPAGAAAGAQLHLEIGERLALEQGAAKHAASAQRCGQ